MKKKKRLPVKTAAFSQIRKIVKNIAFSYVAVLRAE
jgi:hypothetical protein